MEDLLSRFVEATCILLTGFAFVYHENLSYMEAFGIILGFIAYKMPENLKSAVRTSSDQGVLYLIIPVFVTCALRNNELYFETMFCASLVCFFQWVLRARIHTFNLDVLLGSLCCAYTGSLFTFIFSLLALQIQNHLVYLWVSAFRRSCTIGEAGILLTFLSLATTDYCCFILDYLFNVNHSKRLEVTVLIQGSILSILCVPLPLSSFFCKFARREIETVDVNPRESPDQHRRDRLVSITSVPLLVWDLGVMRLMDLVIFYGGILSFGMIAVIPMISMLIGDILILWVRDYIFCRWLHICLLSYWFASLLISLPLIHFFASNQRLIITRKLYHILALIMFSPAIVLAPQFISLSFGFACGILLLLEYVRICRVPPFGNWLHIYLTSYTDSRDQGPVILTHIYLLVGCAFPLWVFPDGASLAPFAGLIILGAGDAAGAIVGSTRGHYKWPGGNKTVEGTVAAFTACMFCLFVFSFFVSFDIRWGPVTLATLLTCMLEAFTKQIDNLTLPVIYSSLLYISN